MVSARTLRQRHDVFSFTNGVAAAALTTHAPELVITDLYLDKTHARQAGNSRKPAPSIRPLVVLVTPALAPSNFAAVEAMKHGAFDYLETIRLEEPTKPQPSVRAVL